MLAAARHSAILAEVQRERIVRVADLAKMLGVSLMTVRRDIEAARTSAVVARPNSFQHVPAPKPLSRTLSPPRSGKNSSIRTPSSPLNAPG